MLQPHATSIHKASGTSFDIENLLYTESPEQVRFSVYRSTWRNHIIYVNIYISMENVDSALIDQSGANSLASPCSSPHCRETIAWPNAPIFAVPP